MTFVGMTYTTLQDTVLASIIINDFINLSISDVILQFTQVINYPSAI